MRPYFEIFETRYYITMRTFVLCSVLLIAYLVLALIGMYKLGGWLFILVSALTLSSITINNVEYAVIKNEKVRNFLGSVVIVVSFIFFFL